MVGGNAHYRNTRLRRVMDGEEREGSQERKCEV